MNTTFITDTNEDFPVSPYQPVLTIDNDEQPNITLLGNGDEMLRIAKDGFYVRGVKLEKDADEAEALYQAFSQFLMWNALTRSY